MGKIFDRILYIRYPYTRRRCGLKAKEKKRTGRKKDIVEGASLDARRIALWDGIARQRPFAITGGFSFFCFVRSGGRSPLVAFDNFIQHGWPYVPSRYDGTYRSVTIYHWSAYTCNNTLASLPPIRETRAHWAYRNELSLRTANYGANLPKPIVTRTFELFRIIFRGVQCGT